MTEHLYVLGHPVAHSKSPAMYNALYPKLGLDWRYDLMDCATEDEACAFIERGGFVSINITTPYKQLAYSYANSASAAAQLAGAANVLVAAPDGYVADNTDGVGCVASLERAGVAVAGARVAVCGTGPAARSIMGACVLAGAADVTLLGRSAERTRAAAEAYRAGLARLAQTGAEANPLGSAYVRLSPGEALDQVKLEAYAYAEEPAKGAVRTAGIVIDATTLGMRAGDPSPIDTTLLHEGQAALDVVYAHGVTAFVAGAQEQGCRTFDGLGMLVGQAVATVEGIAHVRGGMDLGGVDLYAVMEAAARA